MGYVSSRLAPLAHPVTNFRALRQDLRRQRVEGRALVDPQNTYHPSVRAELRRMFTSPFPVETQTLMCNALLAAICWYLLPEAWRSWLFSEFRSPAGFALVMVGWMVADVTSTNLMGHDEEHALRALRSSDPHALHLFVRTKAIAIGIITGVSGTLLALVLHSQDKTLTPTLMMSLSFFVVPAIVVSLGSILGVMYPYRLRGWQFRWAHRKNLRMSVPLGSALLWAGLGAGHGADVAHVPVHVPVGCARAPSQPRRGSARCCVQTVAVFADFVGSGRYQPVGFSANYGAYCDGEARLAGALPDRR